MILQRLAGAAARSSFMELLRVESAPTLRLSRQLILALEFRLFACETMDFLSASFVRLHDHVRWVDDVQMAVRGIQQHLIEMYGKLQNKYGNLPQNMYK